MPWNAPGNNSNDHDPWGGKRNNQTPPDLDKLIGDFIKKIQAFFKQKTSGRSGGPAWQVPASNQLGYGLGLVALLIVVVWFLAGIYIVNPAEEVVILRLGQFARVEEPGLHWMARLLETKYVVDVKKIYTFSLQGDFLTKSSEQSDMVHVATVDPSRKMPDSSDQSKNLVNVELNVQYRITDPRAYLFNIVNPDDTIQEVASGALSDVIGQMKLDEVLTTGRESVSLGVMDRIKRIVNAYNAGLEVIAVTLKKVQSPDQVREAFNDVNRADQDKATYIQQAQAYASKVLPLAQGVAARTLADATAYQQQVVLSAQAQVARYQAFFNAYLASPDVTRERMYLETIQTVLGNTSKVLVDTNGSNNLIYLPLDKIIKQSESGTPNLPYNDNKALTTLPSITHNELANNQSQPVVEVKNDTN